MSHTDAVDYAGEPDALHNTAVVSLLGHTWYLTESVCACTQMQQTMLMNHMHYTIQLSSACSGKAVTLGLSVHGSQLSLSVHV